MPADISSILALEVPVIVRLAQRPITLAEVLQLTPGSILELPKDSDEELDLLINNRQIGRGLAVKIGENFGIRVTQINDTTGRVKAIAGENPVTKPENDDEDLGATAAAMLAGQV